MYFIERVWDKLLNGVYGCGSGVMRALGQSVWARNITNARIIAVMKDQSERLQSSINYTQATLKNMRDALRLEEAHLDAAVSDVKAMKNKRMHERRTRAERMGIPFVYKEKDFLTWMNDDYEIKRIDEMRLLKIRCSNLQTQIQKLQAANHQMQTQQAEFENTVSNVELSNNFEHIADTLKEASNVTFDKLMTDMMVKAYKLADAMQESEDRTKELAAENAEILNVVPVSRTMSPDEERDIIDLIFDTTEGVKAPSKRSVYVKAPVKEAVLA